MTVYLVQRYSGHDTSCVLATENERLRDLWLHRLRALREPGVGYEPDVIALGDTETCRQLEDAALQAEAVPA